MGCVAHAGSVSLTLEYQPTLGSGLWKFISPFIWLRPGPFLLATFNSRSNHCRFIRDSLPGGRLTECAGHAEGLDMTRTKLTGALREEGPWHASGSDVYHNNPNCRSGNTMKSENARRGTGG